MKSGLLLGILFWAGTQLLFAGAWTEKEKGGYAQFSYTWLKYNEIFNGNDPFSGLKRDVSDFTLQGYLQYGITDSWEVIAVVPYKLTATGDELLDTQYDLYPEDTIAAGDLNAFGNIQFGLKRKIAQGKYVLSAAFMTGFPTAEFDQSTGLRTGYDAWTFAPSLLLGRGFNRSYFSLETGVHIKTNDYADHFRGWAEYGYNLNPAGQSTWLIFVLDAFLPVNEGDYNDGATLHTALYQDGEGHFSPGIKLNQQFRDTWWINLSVFGAFWANHAGKAPTITAGLAYDW